MAAGSGRRFGGSKQRARLLGRPLYLHALTDLAAHPRVGRLVLAVPRGEEATYTADLESVGLARRVTVAAGGHSRTESVGRALLALKPPDGDELAVLVHDAARPAAPVELVDALLAALEGGAAGAVPVLECADTLRWSDRPGGPERSRVWRVGTPQAFRLAALREAHCAAAARGEEATDDAVLIEKEGGRIATVEADARIEKVTRREDLAAAACRLDPEERWRRTRTGFGLDHHRLAPGRPLWLCGVRIDSPEGLVGHSDGDVALHALANAILGAVGERDIGHHLPPEDPASAGMPSREIVALALGRALAKGLRAVQAQIVLTAPRPRIGPFVPAMQAQVAEMLGIAEDLVAVHATTGEGLLGDAIEAHALALMGAI